MILGILSDSHGDVAVTTRAVDRLRQGGAELLIHLGDVETADVIYALQGVPTRMVFGNCDADLDLLTHAARSVGVQVDHPAGQLEVDGRTIVFTHGHVEQFMRKAVEDAADYLLHGHSHVRRDDRFAHTRIINPGALHRAARYTAALLDPVTDRLEFIDIPRQ